jgi:hypothetical protein
VGVEGVCPVFSVLNAEYVVSSTSLPFTVNCFQSSLKTYFVLPHPTPTALAWSCTMLGNVTQAHSRRLLSSTTLLGEPTLCTRI